MGSFIQIPIRKPIADVKTSGSILEQLWRELKILRYKSDGINLSSLLDQAEHYFIDAHRSHWRSAGLLYYYSFLNLAKSVLAKKGLYKFSDSEKAKLRHGIFCPHADATLKSLMDLELTLQSASSNGAFALLYRGLVGDPWPFSEDIVVKVSDVIEYSDDIGAELKTLYGLSCRTELVQSMGLLSNDKSKLWHETVASKETAQRIIQSAPGLRFTMIKGSELPPLSKMDWQLTMERNAISLNDHYILKTDPIDVTGSDQYSLSFVIDAFEKFACYSAYASHANFWQFVPKIRLNGQEIFWHPILTGYLFAFSIGHLLRYQPFLLEDGSKHSFLVESWCRQSPMTLLRQFVLELTEPGVRIGSNS